MPAGDKNIGNDVVLREDARITFKRTPKDNRPDHRSSGRSFYFVGYFTDEFFKSYGGSFTPKEQRISLPFAGKILIKLNIAIDKVLCKRIRLYKRMEH